MRNITIWFGAACLSATPAMAQEQGRQPGAVFAELAGACWRAELDARQTDTHCFAAAVGGKMVTDTHKVRNAKGEVVYEGVTIYRLDKASGALAYDYFNSLGAVMKGYGWRAGEEIRFGSTPNAATPEIAWKPGKDAYDVSPAPAGPGQPGRFRRVPRPA